MFKNISFFGIVFSIYCSANAQCPLIDKILSRRDPQSFTTKLNKALQVITISTETMPVGSFKYKEQKYHGDVDVYEQVIVDMPKEKAKTYFANRLSGVARRIAADPDILFSDFKAGKNDKFIIDIGDSKKIGKFSGYNYQSVAKKIQAIKEDLTNDEYTNLKDLLKERPTFDEWAALKEAIRQLTTLRWSLNELIAQEKILRDGHKLSLADAIEGSIVKIDIFAPVTNTEGYMEVTNFFDLFYKDNNQKFSLTKKLPDYKSAMINDMMAFSYNKKFLKATKRLLILAIFLKDNELIAKLSPLMQGPAAALNQILAESEAIRGILTEERNIYCYPVGLRILSQIESFEKRILHHVKIMKEKSLTENDLDPIKKIFESFRRECTRNSHEQSLMINQNTKSLITESLQVLEEKIKYIVENYTREFLMKSNINIDDPLTSLTGRTNVCPVQLSTSQDHL